MNKKWYRSAIVKGVLVVLAVVSLTVATLGFSWITFGVGGEYLNPAAKVPDLYEKTSDFETEMNSPMHSLGDSIKAQKILFKDGKIDGEQIVDIENFYKEDKISGKNESGFAYKLEELLNAFEEEEDADGERSRQIIVCQRVDGGYDYMFWDIFKSKMLSNELTFAKLVNITEEEREDINFDDYLYELENNYDPNVNSGYFGVCDKEGRLIYSDCWQFPDDYRGKFMTSSPLDAENVLALVNENEKWNGRLSEMSKMFYDTIEELRSLEQNYRMNEAVWAEGKTNLTYLILDDENKKVYTNSSKFKDYKYASENYEKLKKNADGKDNAYIYARPSKSEKEFQVPFEVIQPKWQWATVDAITHYVGIEDYRLVLAVDLDYPVDDSFKENAESYEKMRPYIHDVAVDFWISVVVFLISIIWLTAVSGRSNTQEGVKTNLVDRLFTEIPFGAFLGGIGIIAGGIAVACNEWMTSGSWYMDSGGYNYYSRYSSAISIMEFLGIGSIMLLGSVVFFYGYLSCVRKLKAETFFKQLGIVRIWRWFWKWTKKIFRRLRSMASSFWQNRDLLTRTILIFAAFVFIQMLGMVSGFFLFVALIMDALLFAFLMKHTIDKQKVKDGIKEIASGNIEYKIPLEGLRDSNKEMAESINTIGDGLGAAVEQSLKSERLKTDLITNVSHDIKTPLTSIINYVDLLKRENIEDPKIQGYIKVLEEKAQRLKTLTEDVVEASKISSGNISLEMMDLNLVEMLHQTSGEFAEKFEKRGLKLVSNLPETPVMIHADGRRMWRVLANLYNNAAKYAMENTRVYADLVQNDKEVIFSLKNMSEQQLNINAEELTERFIRGDVSRSTEGSGLGLSIAKNLTERQGGEFKLYLDGDLFKVTIVFPKVK